MTSHPSRTEPSWSPVLLGYQKRDLLKEVLGVFGESQSGQAGAELTIVVKSVSLQALGQQYQDTLRKASADDGY